MGASNKKTAHQAFVDEALAAWQDFEETGLHLTDADMRRWLKSWGTEHETSPPEPHR